LTPSKASPAPKKVILVGHSMGGLVARTYVESGAAILSGKGGSASLIDYTAREDVAGILTIDTPHAGSDPTLLQDVISAVLAVGVGGETFACMDAPTLNKAQLNPSSTFLNELNSVAIPPSTLLSAIVSWRGETDGDGIVVRASQDLARVSPSATEPPDTQVFDYGAAPNVSTIENEVSSDFDSHTGLFICDDADLLCEIHTSVQRLPQTVSRIRGFVQSVDLANGPALSAISPAIPIASTDSQTLTVSGRNFQTGLTVALRSPDGIIAVLKKPSVKNVTDTSFKLLAALNQHGVYTIQVTKPGRPTIEYVAVYRLRCTFAYASFNESQLVTDGANGRKLFHVHCCRTPSR
jgi:hypothetical protein